MADRTTSASPFPAVPRAGVLAPLQQALAVATLGLALLLGGGQGTLGDTLVQMLALALVGVSAWRHVADPSARWRAVALLALVPLLPPLLQLLPLPDALWGSAPAREAIAADLAAAGVEPVRRWTLVPLATERALIWLLPAVALFLATQQLAARPRAVLLAVFVAVALASVVLGLAQLAGGADSGLRFYTITNPSHAVGFFANRNHYAGLLAMAIPPVVVGAMAWFRRESEPTPGAWLGVVAGVFTIVVLLLGIAMAKSRAGLLLGMLGLTLALVPAWRLRRPARRIGGRWLAVAAAVAVVLAVQVALLAMLQRFERDPLDDSRLAMAKVTVAAAATHAPLGTGFGGFRAAYETAEALPESSAYVNHAHDDALELWLEGGWLVVPAAGVLLAAFALGGLAAWRLAGDRDAGTLRVLPAVAWIPLLLVLLHSLVDYPLRTTAHLALAGLLAGCLVRPPSRTRE